MKVKFYFLFVGIFLFSFQLHAQCTDVTISSQSDVDSFQSTHGCTTLSGRLLISGNDITNLDGLSALTSIGGLTITNNPVLTNIDGLSAINTVSGPDARIELNGNLALTDIDGLSGLTKFQSTGTGGWISFSSNPSLRNLDGLFFLHEIRGESSAKLDITFNDALENIDGISSLQKIVNNSPGNRASVAVVGNHALTRGCGLYNLLTGPGGPQQCNPNYEPDDAYRCIDFNISGNGAGVTQEAIIAGSSCTVTGCNGDIRLTSQAEVDAFPQTYGCSIIKGNLEIVGMTNNITNLDSLYQIVEVKQLTIAGNFHLESIEGLSSLQTIHEFLSLGANQALRSLHGLENVTTVNSISIRSQKMDDLSGLSGITSVPGGLELRNNSLTTVEGMSNLSSVGTLAITGDSTLTNIDAFSSLTTIGSILLESDMALTAITLTALTTTGNIGISKNPVLSSINFSALESAGNFGITSNPSLTSIGIFPELQSVSRIDISSNLNLTTIDAFPQLTDSPEGIRIAANPKLVNLRGLSHISVITGGLIIDDNDALTSTSGISINRVGALFIRGNANIESLEGFSFLSSATGGGCECSIIGSVISYNPKLLNLNQLQMLTTVGGMLQIQGNTSLTNIDGLRNLASVGYNSGFGDQSIDISDNASLVSIGGLGKLTTLVGGLVISNNDALSSLDGLRVTQVGSRGLDISGNAILSDINGLKNLVSVGGGISIKNNAILKNLNGLQSLQELHGGKDHSAIGISDNPMLENVDSLSNFITISTPFKGLGVTNNPKLTKGCGLYPIINRYFNCMDCPLNDITFSGNGTTKEEILAEGPCDGSPTTCENVTLASQADVDAFQVTHGCSIINGSLVISGNDINNLIGLRNVTNVGALDISNNPQLQSLNGLEHIARVPGGFYVRNNDQLTGLGGLRVNYVGAFYISGNANLTSLSGLDSLTAAPKQMQIVAAFIGSSIDNNPKLENLDALSKLVTVGGMLRIDNNAALTNLDGLSSLTSLGTNSEFGNSSLSIYRNPALVSTGGLRNLAHVPGGLSIGDNDALQAITGFEKVTSTGMNGFNISDNEILTDISGFSNLQHVAGSITISNNPMLPNLNGLRSLKSLSGKDGSTIVISNNPMLSDVDSLSNFTEVSTTRKILTVTNNPNLARGCGLYPLLAVAFNCVVCQTEVNISGNGEDVTEEGIKEGGACEGVDPPIATQPTNLVFSEVTSTSMRLSFTGSRHQPDGYVTIMRVGQSPHPEDAPHDGSAWFPPVQNGNSEVVSSDTDTTFVVTGLQPGTDYYFAIYSHQEFVYVKDEPLQGHQSTLGGGNPTTLAFGNVTDNSMDVTFHPEANRAGYITVMRAFEPALPDEAPENGTSYSIGNVIGCCSIVVGLGMESTLSIVYLEPDIDYYFDVIPYAVNSGSYSYDTAAAISGHQRTLPRVQPYPNPFVEQVIIPFTINDDESDVRIMIMDQMGRTISEVVNDRFARGKHEVRWMRTDMQGNRAGDGVYMYSIVTNNNEPVKGLFVAK